MFPSALLEALLSSRSALRSRRSQYVLSSVALGTPVSRGKTGQCGLGETAGTSASCCAACAKYIHDGHRTLGC